MRSWWRKGGVSVRLSWSWWEGGGWWGKSWGVKVPAGKEPLSSFILPLQCIATSSHIILIFSTFFIGRRGHWRDLLIYFLQIFNLFSNIESMLSTINVKRTLFSWNRGHQTVEVGVSLSRHCDSNIFCQRLLMSLTPTRTTK